MIRSRTLANGHGILGGILYNAHFKLIAEIILARITYCVASSNGVF